MTGVDDSASAALALFGLGYIQDWPHPWAIAVLVFLGSLLPSWFRARKEHARTQRAGTLVITAGSLQITDDRGTADIPIADIVDLDATATDGLEVFVRDGVTTTMEALRGETTLQVAESLRAGLGPRRKRMSTPSPMLSSGRRVEVEDDEAGRLIHVTHGWLTDSGAKRYARTMLVGGLGAIYLALTVVTNPAIWAVVIAMFAGAAMLMRPRNISRLRLRRDGTYLLESHDEVRSGELSEIGELVVADGRIKIDAEFSESLINAQTQSIREFAADYLVAPDVADEVILDLNADAEVETEVEVEAEAEAEIGQPR